MTPPFRRHCWTAQMTMKKDNLLKLSASTVAFISCRSRLTKVLAGAARGKKGSKGVGGLPPVAPATTLISLSLQLMKATVLTKCSLYFILLPGSLCSSDVYRCKSGRCCTLTFFLTFFIISPFQAFLYGL